MDQYNNGNYTNGQNNYSNYNPYNPYNPNGWQYNYQSEADRLKNQYIAEAKAERKQIRTLGNIVGLTLCLYLFCQTLISMLLSSSKIYSLYISSAVFNEAFTAIGVSLFCVVVPFGLMAFINKDKYQGSIVPAKKISAKMLCLWTGFGMMCCVGADYVVGILSYIASMFGVELTTSSSSPEIDSVFACLMCVIGTSLMPAICEEFAMRCCTMGLLKKYGKAFAVVSVSIVFGIIHGNFVQFVFATIVGLITGYITIKTGSIVPAVIIHACNNGMSVFSSILAYIAGDSGGLLGVISSNSVLILYAFWLVVGIVTSAILCFKGAFKNARKEMPKPFENSLAKKIFTFFFTPGMLIPIAIVAVNIFA
ncbi:MAG: CPBP family intramembrane metalloprotease [Clostridiales bacterium]|nr:CPBP family intramembrane metalloprotease [Clostridiales bacterium]